MVGSRDYFDARARGAVNITTILRRPGSTLKPFVYALALEARRLAGDARLRRRAAGRDARDLHARGQAARPRPLPRVAGRLVQPGRGARAGAGRAGRAGRAAAPRRPDDARPPPTRYPLSLAIGDAEFRSSITPARSRRSATAAAPWPRAPSRACAYRAARRSAARRRRAPRVFSPEVAYLVFDILSDPDARRPMFGSGAPHGLAFPVALKTGTTRAYTDDLGVRHDARIHGRRVGRQLRRQPDGRRDGHAGRGAAGARGVRRARGALRHAHRARATDDARARRGLRAVGKRPGPDCPHKHESFAPGTRPRRCCTGTAGMSGGARWCGHRSSRAGRARTA